jgi:hypothetical protein
MTSTSKDDPYQVFVNMTKHSYAYYKSGSGDTGSRTYLKTGIVCAANLCRQALSELPDPPLLYQLHYKLLDRRQDVFGSDSMGQIWGEAIHEWFESVPQCLPAMGMSYVS